MTDKKTCNVCDCEKPTAMFRKWCRACICCKNDALKAKRRMRSAEEAEQGNAAVRERRIAYPERYLLSQARHRAKARDMDFDITLDDIAIPEHCPVLGIKLEAGRGRVHDASPSLDRIDNSLGYVKGNVAVISAKANILKNHASLDEVRKIYDWMAKSLPSKPL